jgi:hypothetical protein
MEKTLPRWIWMKHTVVLVAESYEAAVTEYKRFTSIWPNHTLRESTSGYDCDGKTYTAIFWMSH